MAVPFIQTTMTSGEIDPALRRRNDVKVYYSGLAKALNLLPRPQGGVQQRGGLRHWGKARRALADRSVTAGMMSTPLVIAAGTLADLAAGTGTGATFTAPAAGAVIVSVDLGTVFDAAAVDLVGFSAASGGGLNALIVETSLDALTWSEWARRDVRPSVNTRRVATPPRQSRRLRHVRLRAAVVLADLTLRQIRVMAETAVKLPVRVLRAQVATDPWFMVLTPGNCDLYRNKVFVTAVPLRYSAAQVPEVTSAHDGGGVLLFHNDVPTQLLQKRGADVEWHVEDYAFTGIPTRTFEDTGVTEPIISATRGYPGCGTFWNARLVLAKFKSLPQTVLLSRQDAPTNLDTSGTLATDAFLLDLRGDEQASPSIRRVRGGPRLEIYTQMGFFASSDSIAAKGQGFGFIIEERVSVEANARVVDGPQFSYFLEDGGNMARQLVFDDNSTQRYSSAEISVYAGHLVKNGRDLAFRPSQEDQQLMLLNMITEDGGWVIGSLLPSQELLGWTPHDAGGPVRALAAVGERGDILLAVERGDDIHLNLLDDAATLDMSVVMAAAPVLAGLDHLNGRDDVYVRCDAGIFGPLTVTGGSIAGLDIPPGQSVEVGVPFQWQARQLRLVGDAQRQIAFNRTIAVSVVKLTLDRASHFEMGVDDDPWREIDLEAAAGDPTLAERDFSGDVEEDGFLGLGDGAVNLRGQSVHPFALVSILREATW